VLRTRILTAAIALPLVLAAILFLPPAGFSIFIAIVGCWSLYEIAMMTTSHGPLSIFAILATGLAPLFAILAIGDYGVWPLPVMVIAVMLSLVAMVAINGPDAVPKGLPLEVEGAMWVGVLTPYFALLRNLPNGIAALAMMLLIVIASDTGAYFGGRAFGRHKLAPRVSPNKTIEGAIAGLVTSVLLGLILRPMLSTPLSAAAIAAISAIIAILAQLGDLANSAFKRSAGVKDSGWIFPGHGGLLDRTCSLVFAAAFTYYCFR